MANQLAKLTAAELFSGGGCVHLALAQVGVRVVWANDYDKGKAAVYRDNFPGTKLDTRSVVAVRGRAIPRVDILHASAPCQAFSISGDRQGLDDVRGMILFQVGRLLGELAAEGRLPRVVVIENVMGLLTADRGGVFALACSSLAAHGYLMGAVLIDALDWVPQRRKRMFLVAVREGTAIPHHLVSKRPDVRWHPGEFVRAHAALSVALKAAWRWWVMPTPPLRTATLKDIVERDVPKDLWSPEESHQKAVDLMRADGWKVLKELTDRGPDEVGLLLKTKHGSEQDGPRVRIVRSDGYARTILTGDSHAGQRLLFPGRGKFGFALRQFSKLELARLNGLPEHYKLPPTLTATRRLTGDAIVVPVYRHLAEHLLVPLACASEQEVRQRPLPRRDRTAGDPGHVGGNRPMKKECRSVTVYLPLPSHQRLANAAAAAGRTIQEELLSTYDRALGAEGAAPLARYTPPPRRKVGSVRRCAGRARAQRAKPNDEGAPGIGGRLLDTAVGQKAEFIKTAAHEQGNIWQRKSYQELTRERPVANLHPNVTLESIDSINVEKWKPKKPLLPSRPLGKAPGSTCYESF